MEEKKDVGEGEGKSAPLADTQHTNITHIESTEMNWLADNNTYLEEHFVGQWVAVSGYHLVAHGHDLGKVVVDAKEAGFDKPLLTRIRGRDPGVLHVPSFRIVG